MASADGDQPGGGGARWSGSSTPPDVYGSFSYPGLIDDLEALDALEPTQEDLHPPADVKSAHQVRAKMLNHVQELEESGEYDIRALAPLRHLLDQDWTDPNVRSRLKTRVEQHDQILRTQDSAPMPGKTAEAPTVQVRTIPTPTQPKGPGPVTPPASGAQPSVAVPPSPPAAPAQPPPAKPAAGPAAQRTAPSGPTAPASPQAPPSRSAAQQNAATRPAAVPASVKPAPAPPAVGKPPMSEPAGAASPAPGQPLLSPPPAVAIEDIFVPLSAPEAPPAVVVSAPFQWTPPDGGQDNGPSRRDPMAPVRPTPAAQPKNPVPGRRLLKLGGAGGKGQLRTWLVAAGAFAVVAVWALPTSLYSPAPPPENPAQFVLSSEPKAEVYQGGKRLGETPMLLQASQVGEGLALRRSGYREQTFTLTSPLPEDKVEKRSVKLEVAPVALDWVGLPEGSTLTWNGTPSLVAELSTAEPGTYQLKVTAPGRPSVEVPVVVPDPGQGTAVASVAVGPLLEKALAKQPALSMALKTSQGMAPKLPLKVSITGQKSFATTTTLEAKTTAELVLPGPGTYLVKVPASDTHQAFSKAVKVQEGGSHRLEIALTPVPPKVASAPAASSSEYPGSGSSYSPPPVYYAPPPSYSGGGGGGSGGRIAPPSF